MYVCVVVFHNLKVKYVRTNLMVERKVKGKFSLHYALMLNPSNDVVYIDSRIISLLA